MMGAVKRVCDLDFGGQLLKCRAYCSRLPWGRMLVDLVTADVLISLEKKKKENHKSARNVWFLMFTVSWMRFGLSG